ncbi:sensor histidine kinase [Rhodococcoides fascians]|uniref:sensor histidine kinase n=2 Tax=Nocardiaceae TaxID=85025 RepID=UPI000ACA4847|nr:sensor histidine kinase [Rhodococcus fascians]
MATGPRAQWIWFSVIGVVVAIAVVLLLDSTLPGNTSVALASLSALALWVLAIGLSTMKSPLYRRESTLFACGVIAFATGAIVAAPAATAVFPAVFPLLFMSLPLRWAVVSSIAIDIVGFGTLAATGRIEAGDLPLAVAVALIASTVGPVVGWVVVTAARRTENLDRLVVELAESRAEAALLSHAAGVATERERLARDIHDTLAQGFISIVTVAQALEPHLASAAPHLQHHLDLIEGTARENLDEARTMVVESTPPSLAVNPLRDVLHQLTDSFSATTGIQANFGAVGRPPRSTDIAVDVVLLRCAQESLHNVRRHSGATAVSILLEYLDHSIRMTLSDNGIGFKDHQEGHGLHGMRARVGDVGGTLTLPTAHVGGATVHIEIPL